MAFVLVLKYIIDYPQSSRYKEYRSELIKNHKTTKAYVYRVTNVKKHRVYYRFTINSVTYTGDSKFSIREYYPEEGDSIYVYYNEKDPNINLWKNFCE